jgi:hypothetical protein
MRYEFDSHDWSMSRVTERWPDGKPKTSKHIVAFRCASCGKPTLGCKDHWFCGLCEPCRAECEDRPW